MSSPSLNNLILFGCMLAYISIIFNGLNSSLLPKQIQQRLMNIICPARAWLLCISFTIGFGSMFSKTWRVHSIFTNISITKRGIHDFRLLSMVALLLTVDILLLTAWQILDPLHRELIYETSSRVQFKQDIEIVPYREECKSNNLPLWFVLVVLHKGLLMIYGSFLAWKTRHVSIPALNDSKYIGISVYIFLISCILGALVGFVPPEQVELSYSLTSLFIIVCTTSTQCLVFVPKIIEVYRDPNSHAKQPRATIRSQLSRKSQCQNDTRITPQYLNSLANENKQYKIILSMQNKTFEQLLTKFNDTGEHLNYKRNLGTSKYSGTTEIEPYELDALLTMNTENENDDDRFHLSEDEQNILSSTANIRRKVSLALSLCVLSKIDIEQINDHHIGTGHGVQSQQQLAKNYESCVNPTQSNNNNFVREISDVSDVITYQPVNNSIIIETNNEDESTSLLYYSPEHQLDESLNTDIMSTRPSLSSDTH
ncbi:unnamed protein product [Didymodactylos carnosus]|uniref:G-protein coupled receptors family 3 profile domain-containing protein n=1 Tax=Didymodactylos carnosus TaxID=1234261 RepID=A0A8S2EDJ6_9BILA|nr:unnamed protein product [Didymodactylos carnosus]CAF4008291.1 unnamed protein product [Didymodactylos carnosus]